VPQAQRLLTFSKFDIDPSAKSPGIVFVDLDGPRTESVNRDGPDFKAAQIGETYGADHYSDDTPGPRWRGALMVVMAVLAFAIVGTVGALGYGVMFSRSVVPPVASIIRAVGANSIVPRYGKTWPSKASAGPNEKVTSREEPPGDQEVPKRVPRVISAIPISPNPNTPEPATSEWAPDPPLAPQEEADTLPTAAAAPAAASPALSPPSGLRHHLSRFSESKKIDLVSNRADMSAPTDTVNATGYGTTDASTAAAKPEPAEALGVEKPLMALAPNATRPGRAAIAVSCANRYWLRWGKFLRPKIRRSAGLRTQCGRGARLLLGAPGQIPETAWRARADCASN
jgi:hypothetical protein